MKDEISRREALKRGIALAAGIGAGGIASAMGRTPSAEDKYLDAALRAFAWTQTAATQGKTGPVWLVTPGKEGHQPNLYSGMTGVVLFYLELHRATKSPEHLKAAKAVAEALARVQGEEPNTGHGLYTGFAGNAFALKLAERETGSQECKRGFEYAMRRIKEDAKRSGDNVKWNESTDIVSGSAGIGLFLLTLADPEALALAEGAGRALIALGRKDRVGLKWPMDPAFPRLMPNFSHGTAGVCYFLTRLYDKTKKKEFLNAAIEGAKYLDSVAKKDNDGCIIFHHEPEGEGLFYLGWCHGPAGTSRLFHSLAESTGDKTWSTLVTRGAKSTTDLGAPEKQSPGYWNNYGFCCGTAGIGDFFLSLHQATGNKQYLDLARKAADIVLAKATRDGAGLKWVHAEHRVRPEETQAQTGLMQGSAGAGLFLLRMDAQEKGRKPLVRLPDSPF